ncbi:MAG TPA: CopD family protein [Longimicrobiaceae bacterium]|nr:CopD family protein [Longimicrobiaceae bacterium]
MSRRRARRRAALVGAALAGAGVAAATGIGNALFHVHAPSQLWTTSYGLALLLKVALLAVVAGLGFFNWRFVLPGVHEAAAAGRIRRTAAMEIAAGLAVVLVTAVLVALPTP